MLSTINAVGNGRWYFLTTIVCATTDNYFTIEGIYSGITFQNSLANILNVYKRFLKLIHQPMKPHGLVGQFPSIHKGEKETYNSIDAFLHQLKEDIGGPIATRYVRDITGMTTR